MSTAATFASSFSGILVSATALLTVLLAIVRVVDGWRSSGPGLSLQRPRTWRTRSTDGERRASKDGPAATAGHSAVDGPSK